MKNKIKYISLVLIIIAFVFTACEDRTDITTPGPASTGTASFASFVAIGNSLTAGFQNNALYESSQEYSFNKMIADLVGANFVQPLMTDPGTGERVELKEFIFVNGEVASAVLIENPGLTAPSNIAYAAPYNNLGIPGAVIGDMLDTSDFAQKSVLRENPFFAYVLRNPAFGKSVIQQALTLQPTFVSLWIGNNDVLGYAASGGTRGTNATFTLPTETVVFTTYLNYIAALLADTTGVRKVVIANIPDVENIPFFTTVGPQVGASLAQAQQANPAILGLFYAATGAPGYGLAAPQDLIEGKTLVTLLGAEFAAHIGETGFTAGGDANYPFGLHPLNPFPNAYVLEPNEIATVQTAVSGFNTAIKNVATASSWGYVDINAFFDKIKESETTVGAYWIDGLPFTTKFIEGNAFSLDGVHPSSQGYAIVANEFIKVINQKFNAAIPSIDVSTIPGSLPLAKKVSFMENYRIKINPEALKYIGYF